MSAAWSFMGALLLLAATAPQAMRLARTRRADDFSLGFAALNAVGLVFLAGRSWEIGERWFLALNLATSGFWLAIVILKVAGGARPAVPAASEAPTP